MEIDFYRTLRGLAQENLQGSLRYPWIGLVMLLLAGWGVWLFNATVPLYATSHQARLAVSGMGSPVAVAVGGRVMATHLSLGREVAAGDILVELDDRLTREELKGVQAELIALEAQLEARRQEEKVVTELINQQSEQSKATIRQAQARLEQVDALTRFVEETGRQREYLYRQSLVPQSDYHKAQSDVLQQRAEVQAAALEVKRLQWQEQREKSESSVRLAFLHGAIAELQGGIAAHHAKIDALTKAIENYRILAPLGGQIGEMVELQVGAVVQAGDRLATIIPRGKLQVVADFEPASAIGRLMPGQVAIVRFAGFPWTQYGSLHATVANVGSEVRAGGIQVELDLQPPAGSKIPLQHGLPGQVEVVVEQISPWALITRKAGSLLRQTASPSIVKTSE